jgi:tRNA(Ile)-lysidine synthase
VGARIIDTVRSFAEGHGLTEPGRVTVVGCSGGLDSTVLAHALVASGVEIILAHVNYRLRGDASEADERAVHALGQAIGAEVVVHTPENWYTHGDSLQDAARVARYHFFEQVAGQIGSAHVAVAHHQDDQAETLLLQLARGAGLEGLAGMAPERPMADGLCLVRPLLNVSRGDLRAYAEAHGLSWQIDTSNDSSKYRRSVVRREVMPALEKEFGEGVGARIASSASLLRSYLESSFGRELDLRFAECLVREGPSGGELSVMKLLELDSAWRGRVILEAVRRFLPGALLSARVAKEIEALLTSQPGRRWHRGTCIVWREQALLRFGKMHESGEQMLKQEALETGRTVNTPAGRIRSFKPGDRGRACPAPSPLEVCFDMSLLGGELAVRTWREGDRISIGAGSKKVSDVLSERGVPHSVRPYVPVILAGEEVIWVPGCRRAPVAYPGSGRGPVVCVVFRPESSWEVREK